MMDKLVSYNTVEEYIFCLYLLSKIKLKLILVCFFFLVEIDDLKKITNSLTVLCSEKQKQEKVRASCVGNVYLIRIEV